MAPDNEQGAQRILTLRRQLALSSTPSPAQTRPVYISRCWPANQGPPIQPLHFSNKIVNSKVINDKKRLKENSSFKWFFQLRFLMKIFGEIVKEINWSKHNILGRRQGRAGGGHRIFPHSLCHSPGPATVRSGDGIIGDVTQDGDSDPDQRSAHIRPAETISRGNNKSNKRHQREEEEFIYNKQNMMN